MHKCMTSTIGAPNIIIFSSVIFLVPLPLNVFVLYLGLQRWRRRGPGATMRNSDLFTYHMAVMELVSVLGTLLMCCGVHTDIPQLEMPGFQIYCVTVSGQMCFHTLTCVERYIAVVHPIRYLDLRKTKWIRIRNRAIGCVWLLSFLWINLMYLKSTTYALLNVGLTGLGFTIISFCCFSVLYVLNRPGPADRVGGRQHIDQSKLRALYTIEAIMGVLLLRLGGSIVASALYPTALLGEAESCVLWVLTFWFFLPSGLVLPLFFLHREGKLLCCQRNAESGQGSD
ncbi:unnamed protein product [Pleuronectes platessa]|uniref:G-protein coupled receptors family 1 profile domain-containing protein n=1 Tax=Pleuronectes platessa TaxID=8262 RepID=A0A9N7UZF8_PLEPL|nr:unnamed protein product [Pleuronectes platessa]